MQLELTVQSLGAAVWWQTVWDPYAHWQCSTPVLLQLARAPPYASRPLFLLSVLGEAFLPLSLPHHSQGSHVPGIRVPIGFPSASVCHGGRPSPESQYLRSALSVTALVDGALSTQMNIVSQIPSFSLRIFNLAFSHGTISETFLVPLHTQVMSALPTSGRSL